MKYLTGIFILAAAFFGCKEDSDDDPSTFHLSSIAMGSIELLENESVENVPIDQNITITFSQNVDISALSSSVTLRRDAELIDFSVAQISGSSFEIQPVKILRNSTIHELTIENNLVSVQGNSFRGATFQFRTEAQQLELLSVLYGNEEGLLEERITDVPLSLDLTLTFSSGVEIQNLSGTISIGSNQSLSITQPAENSIFLSVTPKLQALTRFVLSISDNLVGANGELFPGYAQEFYTQLDSNLKFPAISDVELLTKVQEQTFKYFWDFAHPTSGLIRERNTSGNLVTIGGSGFGVMAIVTGIERGFITRQEGIDQLEKIVYFLENADRFHGAWSHWMDGTTGKTIPFSNNDDGADLVETAFMIQGLLAVREYLDDTHAQELAVKNKITSLWEAVEWDWFTQGGQEVLYWHWSPNFGWDKNLQIRGWNEALIIYVLAAASPTHSIDAEVYHTGWAHDGAITNGGDFYGTNLPLGQDGGGPLFFSHYSFLGLDPRNLEDQYANYWDQNVSHSLINRAYCISNPLNYVGYSEACWGLTASDGNDEYSAHSPNNDRGVITPTAAVSALPYTPDESMAALRHFYYLLGDKTWGEYGFYDAFNITENWYARSYLAIDQGPIILMIENYRTGLFWDLFMQNNEIGTGLDKLGFTSY